VLGPFQGPVACTRIRRGKGVCGTCWAREESVVVPDVDLFPGHIGCSSKSRSEICVPLRGRDKKMIALLDIDSKDLESFDEIDVKYLEQLHEMI
jgi:L-methionine (R)-S-oxide reductase